MSVGRCPLGRKAVERAETLDPSSAGCLIHEQVHEAELHCSVVGGVAHGDAGDGRHALRHQYRSPSWETPGALDLRAQEPDRKLTLSPAGGELELLPWVPGD